MNTCWSVYTCWAVGMTALLAVLGFVAFAIILSPTQSFYGNRRRRM